MGPNWNGMCCRNVLSSRHTTCVRNAFGQLAMNDLQAVSLLHGNALALIERPTRNTVQMLEHPFGSAEV
jgi:hypothetical protein